MGRRANPLALRLKSVMNWPSNVSHPLLQQYVRHIFQHSLVATPQIRASTSQIWINVTLFEIDSNNPLKLHPKVKQPVLDFHLNPQLNLKKASSRMEQRMKSLTNSHPFYKPIFKRIPYKDLVEASLVSGTSEALQIYKRIPIKLKINIIKNPLLNAEIMAKHCANALQKGVPLQRIFKTYLKSMR